MGIGGGRGTHTHGHDNKQTLLGTLSILSSDAGKSRGLFAAYGCFEQATRYFGFGSLAPSRISCWASS